MQDTSKTSKDKSQSQQPQKYTVQEVGGGGENAQSVQPQGQSTQYPSGQQPIPQQHPVQPQQGQGVLQPVQSGQPVMPPKPKKRFPKMIIFGILFIGFLAFLISMVLRYKPNLPLIGNKGEITMWGVTEDELVMRSLIDEYKENNPNSSITYIRQSQEDYRERLTNTLAKGEGPDIFEYHSSWVPMFLNDLDVMPETFMSIEEFKAEFFPVMASDLMTKDGLVGVPLEYDALALYINEDLFAAAAKSPPVIWDELRKVSCDLTTFSDGNIQVSGVALGRTENVDHWQEIVALMMYQNGTDFSNLAQTQINIEEAIKFFSIYSKGQACPGAAVKQVWNQYLPPSTVAFASGKLAMYFGPTWRAAEINKLNPDLRYKTVPIPQLRKEDPEAPDVTYASYWVQGVWERSANTEVAWDFLEYLSGDESLKTLYEERAKVQVVGRPYPKPRMSILINEDPIVGSVISLAPNAESWYLASSTYDGDTGINSQISGVFKIAVDGTISGKSASKLLPELISSVIQLLARYGIRIR